MAITFSIGAKFAALRSVATNSTDPLDFSFFDALLTQTLVPSAIPSHTDILQTAKPPAGDWTVSTLRIDAVSTLLIDDAGHVTEHSDLIQSGFVASASVTSYTVDSGPIDLEPASANGQFDIVIHYTGDQAYASYFTAAAARWSQIITGDLPDRTLQDGTFVDDLLIDASVEYIDGAGGANGNVLGSAGPSEFRPGTYLPIYGAMRFDSYDLADMAANGTLDDVILHEMGHILGIGTVWELRNLVAGSPSYYGYSGANALAEYRAMSGNTSATSVPVEPGTNAGSSGSHWAESVFDSELMTPYVEAGSMPLSRLTIAALMDLGYTVNMAAAEAYSFPGGGAAGAVSISDVTITEGNSGTRVATFTVTRTGGTGAFSINYGTVDGSAISGSDFIAKSGTLTFGVGVNSQTIAVTIFGDTIAETNEAFGVNLYGATNGASVADFQGIGTIVNDDSGAGSISINDVTVMEGNNGTQSATFTVTRTGGSAAFSVNFATANGTATSGSDYAAASGTLNFANGVNSQTVTVLINGDTAVESNETFFVNLSNGTNGATITDSQGQATISNDDSGPGSVSINDVTITEGDNGTQAAIFTVTRTGGTAAFTVNFATADGTTTVGSDYAATSGTLNFAAGVNTQTVTVIVNGDLTRESNEAFFVNLSGATNGATIADGQGQGTINNNDDSIPLPDDYADSLTDLTSPFGQIASGGSTAGSLESAGDRDWFRVSLAAGATVTFGVQGESSGSGTLHDPYLFLYNSAGQLLVQDDDSGAGFDSELTYTPGSAGIYYLAAAGYADSSTGTYRISLSQGGPGADDFADSLWDSTVPIGQVTVGGSRSGVLEVVGDRDWFAVNLTAGLNYTINLAVAGAGSGMPLDPYLRFYNSNGVLISENDDIDGSSGNLNSQLTFQATTTGTYYIAAGAYDDSYAGQYAVSVAVANRAPQVNLPSGANVIASTAGQTFQVSSLFSGSDPDNNPLTYFLYDSNAAANSGHFVVNGTTVAAGSIYQVTAAQLAQATFVAGAAGVADDILVQAFDGQAYSGWNSQVHLSVNTPPTVSRVSAATVTASTAGQSFAFSSLFAGSDADGDPLTYYLYDSNAAANSGHWVVDGVTVAAGIIYPIIPSQLAQTSFVAGATGTSDDILVQTYDGRVYSGWTTQVHVNGPVVVNIAPTVSLPNGANVQASLVGQSLAFSLLFAGSDANGDPLTYYLYDSNASANSGHWVVNGTTVAAQSIYQVSAAQLAQTSFVVGAGGTSDDLLVQVYDGKAYSGWNTQVHVSAPVNTAPTVSRPSGADVTASTAGQSFAFSSLFAGSDYNGDPLTYYLYDSNPAANSGHWVVNGTTVAAGVIYPVSAAQLAQTSFVVGAAGTSDDILVQAYDGQAYSGWTTQVHVSAPVVVNIAPTVSRPGGANVKAGTAGQSLAFSSLFAGSDANGDALTYYLYDSNTASNTGHWVVNGSIVAAQTIYQVSASQLAQTSFVAGAAGTADDILVQVYDGQAYSGWNTQVHVTVNTPPTISMPLGGSVTASTAGQSYAFSSLFAGHDINSDPLIYYIYDGNAAANSGHWVVNGSIVAPQTIYQISVAQLSQTNFVAGAAGVVDDIQAQSYDGMAYSGWAAHVLVNGPTNAAPTISLPSGPNVTASLPGQSFAFSSLFAGNDANGDPLTYYLYDGTTAANSGHWSVNGTSVAAGVIYQVSAAQLAQTTFVAGAAGTADELYVQDYDGQAYSGWNAHVQVAVPNNNAPTISLPSGTAVHANAGQSLAASGLFSGSDLNGDTLSYYVYDSNTAANSGHFAINGTTVAAGVTTLVTAAQLAQTTFVAGATGTTDYLYVEAFDGQAYSPWAEFHVFV